MKTLQHNLNEVHLYCRFKDIGFCDPFARRISHAIGIITKPIVYPMDVMQRHGILLWAAGWLVFLCVLHGCTGLYFKVPDVEYSSTPLGPDRCDSGPLIERWRLR